MLGRAGRRVVTSLLSLVLRHHRAVGRLLAAIGFLLLLVVVFRLVASVPSAEIDLPAERELQLRTDQVDTLEFWIEEREGARARGVVIPEGLW